MGLNIHIARDAHDAARVAEEGRLKEIEEAEIAYMAEQERKAESLEGRSEILLPGYDPTESMRWDNNKVGKARRKELMEMRRKNIPLRPEARQVHGQSCTCGDYCPTPGTLENIYVYDEDLKVFAEGLACVNCSNWKPDSNERHRELHERLARVTGSDMPTDEYIDTHCGYCGNTLAPRENTKITLTKDK